MLFVVWGYEVLFVVLEGVESVVLLLEASFSTSSLTLLNPTTYHVGNFTIFIKTNKIITNNNLLIL